MISGNVIYISLATWLATEIFLWTWPCKSSSLTTWPCKSSSLATWLSEHACNNFPQSIHTRQNHWCHFRPPTQGANPSIQQVHEFGVNVCIFTYSYFLVLSFFFFGPTSTYDAIYIVIINQVGHGMMEETIGVCLFVFFFFL